MGPGLTDRRSIVERRLFDANAQLRRARSELEVIDAQLEALQDDADEAQIRMLVSETALAHRTWREAQGHLELLKKELAAVRQRVAELEQKQDELLAKLVL
jgi:flagellar biosynthesis chaperone FliJ